MINKITFIDIFLKKKKKGWGLKHIDKYELKKLSRKMSIDNERLFKVMLRQIIFFYLCLKGAIIPKAWKASIITIIPKKLWIMYTALRIMYGYKWDNKWQKLI